MEVQIQTWVEKLITDAINRRDWSALPNSFQQDATRMLFNQIKPHFGRGEIKQRIAASKASTFVELWEACELGQRA